MLLAVATSLFVGAGVLALGGEFPHKIQELFEALVGAFAVAPDGLESVFFLLAIFQQSPGPGAPLGALLGVAVAAMLGYGIYRGSMGLDLRRFFRWTGVFIILVAAGFAASILRKLHDAGVWNWLQEPV